jgi:hypothetical protein
MTLTTDSASRRCRPEVLVPAMALRANRVNPTWCASADAERLSSAVYLAAFCWMRLLGRCGDAGFNSRGDAQDVQVYGTTHCVMTGLAGVYSVRLEV